MSTYLHKRFAKKLLNALAYESAFCYAGSETTLAAEPLEDLLTASRRKGGVHLMPVLVGFLSEISENAMRDIEPDLRLEHEDVVLLSRVVRNNLHLIAGCIFSDEALDRDEQKDLAEFIHTAAVWLDEAVSSGQPLEVVRVPFDEISIRPSAYIESDA